MIALGKRSVLRFGKFVLQKRTGARARSCCWIRTEESKRKRQMGARFPGRQIPCIFSVTEIALAKRLTTVDQSPGGLSHKIVWLDSAAESFFSQRGWGSFNYIIAP